MLLRSGRVTLSGLGFEELNEVSDGSGLAVEFLQSQDLDEVGAAWLGFQAGGPKDDAVGNAERTVVNRVVVEFQRFAGRDDLVLGQMNLRGRDGDGQA